MNYIAIVTLINSDTLEKMELTGRVKSYSPDGFLVETNISTKEEIKGPRNITKIVCDYYGVPIRFVLGASRSYSLITPRHISIYFCRVILDMSWKEIGKFFNREHSSAMQAYSIICKKLSEPGPISDDICKLKLLITNKAD